MDELALETKDRLTIIRLNVQEEVGRELALVYGFNFTPTFIFISAEGDELWREVGGLDLQRVQDSLE